MRVLLCLAVVVATVSALPGSVADIKAKFDALIEKDGMELSKKQYAFRLKMFLKHYKAADTGTKITWDLAMSQVEKKRRKGGRRDPDVKANLALQKREEEELLVTRAPSAYDSRSSIGLNDAVNQGSCGNCYLHTFVAAVEVAYKKQTGELKKFSEQEMTDCFYKGCDGGDYRYVSNYMSYTDKLGLRTAYGPYKSQPLTCRAPTTQDALEGIQVTGFVDVTPATLEAAIVKYGAVMTCMDWPESKSDPCYMGDYEAGDVVEGKSYEAGDANGCAHAVLIVGYTPTYLIVRNSHGKSFGGDGYFKIKKGINACGVEDVMAAVVTERRSGSKSLASNKCPADKPKFCSEIYTCVPSNERCVTPDDREEIEKREIEELAAMVESDEALLVARSIESVQKREEGRRRPDFDNWGLEKRCADTSTNCAKYEKYGMCSKSSIAALCPMTCTGCGSVDEEEEEEVCQDQSSKCAVMAEKLTCSRVSGTCPVTCGVCVPDDESLLEPPSDETMGQCYSPTIENGRVSNGNMMSAKEELSFTCNSGYTKSSGTSKCLIQNVLTNDANDARLAPACIKTGSDTVEGNGESYTGTKSTTTTGGECMNWDQVVFEGELYAENSPEDYALGNHNMCRNPGGSQPVPFCISTEGDTAASIHYCFDYPGCSACTGGSDRLGSCNRNSCKYTDYLSKSRTDYFWQYCAETCCAAAGC